MTDDMTRREPTSMDEASGDSSAGSAGPTDEYAWTEPAGAPERGEKAREWMAQLQAMIEQLATQAAPVVREVGIKAAELAAAAGEKAGPVAARTAEVTGQAGQRLAERARGLAAELRRDQAAGQPEGGTTEPMPGGTTTAEPMAEPSTEASEDRPAGVS